MTTVRDMFIMDSESNGIYFPVLKYNVILRVAFNAGSESANLLCTTCFEEDTNLQFGRRIWVPPNSHMRSSYHLLAPARTSADQQSVETQTLLFDADVSVEIPLRQQWDRPQQHNYLRIGHKPLASIVLGDPISMASASPNRAGVYDFVHAARCENNLWRNLTPIGNLPAGEAALDAIDHLVIADDRVTHDLATLRTVRRWLYGGGRHLDRR